MSPAWHGMRRGSVFGICLGDRYLRIFVLFRGGGEWRSTRDKQTDKEEWDGDIWVDEFTTFFFLVCAPFLNLPSLEES